MFGDHGFDVGSVSALSGSNSKSVCFSRDLQRQTCTRQLRLETFIAAPQPLQLVLLDRAAWLTPGRQTVATRRIAGLAPLGQMTKKSIAAS